MRPSHRPHLSAGREVAIEGRLRFEEFETSSGDYASRIYIAADQIEFLASRRNRDPSQAEKAPEAEGKAAASGEVSHYLLRGSHP